MKKIISTCLIMLLVANILMMPLAKAESLNENQLGSNALTEELIELVNPYVEIKNGKYNLTNISSLKKEISKREIELVMERIKEVNTLVKEHKKIEQSSDSFIYEVSDEEMQKLANEAGYEYTTEILNVQNDNILSTYSAWSYNGVNKLEVFWWGVEIWLSKTTVGNIIGGTVTAGGVVINILLPGVGWTIAIAVAGFVIGATGSYYAKPIVVAYNWLGEQKYAYVQTP